MRNFLLITPFFLFSGIAFGQTIWFVDASNSGTQNGTSWATAFVNLQDAIDSSSVGDTIWVAKGTYYPTKLAGAGTNPRDKSFLINYQSRIYGGFDGTETTWADRNTDSTSLHVTNKTTLSGDLGTLNDNSDNSYHVVVVVGSQLSCVLDGFEVRDGNADSMSIYNVNGASLFRNHGAGIYSYNSYATFSNCIIRENQASSGGAGMNNTSGGSHLNRVVFTANVINGTFSQNPNGGGAGMRNDGGSANVTDSYFIANENSTNQGGGAIRNENSSTALFRNVVIKNNYSENGDGGGGMYNSNGSEPTLINVSFISNSTTNQGGAMYNDDSKPKLYNCLFFENVGDGGAGAIESDGGSDMELTYCRFIGNTTNGDGGAIQNWQSSPTIDSCYFEGNQADGDGGAVFNYNNCSPWIANSTFVGNDAASNGGAIYNRRNCNPILTNLLIYDNDAGNYGGGIYTIMSNSEPCNPVATNITITENHAGISGGGAFDDGAGSSKLRNSILFNNDAPSNEDVDAPAASAITALRYVIIGNDFYSFGSNPPTTFSAAVFVNPTNDDFRLVPNSVAKNAGDGALFSSSATPNISSITADLDGNDRIMGSGIDLGAYEICSDTLTPIALISVTPNDSVLANTSVVFTASVTNEGTQPSFQWLKNGNVIAGENALTYSATSDVDFVDGDLISFWIESNEQCLDVDTAVSNIIQMHVIATDTNDTTIDTLDAIGDLQSLPDFRVYPNPVSSGSILMIHGEGLEADAVSLIDMSGRQVKRENMTSTSHALDLKSVSPGMYFIALHSKSGWVSTQRVVVSP
jgi:hypothetical protein